MATTKNIIDIINIQNSCKEIIQELYTYETRPNEILRSSNKYAKIDEAIRLEILEYDEYEDELSLSHDTQEYYKTRLGQNNDTYVGLIGERLVKLSTQLNNYNIRIRNIESTDKEIKLIYKILAQIPSILRYNLHAIASNSIFAFKNEANFEIKMLHLQTSQDEILELMNALNDVDSMLKEQYNFFKSMKDKKINSVIIKLKHNSSELESIFKKLYDDIKNYINQSIKDGKFIKKLQQLKKLKDENKLLSDTNIAEFSKNKSLIITNIKEIKIPPDDRIHDYIDIICKIIQRRELEFKNSEKDSPLSVDFNEKLKLQKSLYNYQKLNRNFLSQEKDLVTFLVQNSVDDERLLGVFIRMLKNFSSKYQINYENFITINHRQYIEIYSEKREVI